MSFSPEQLKKFEISDSVLIPSIDNRLLREVCQFLYHDFGCRDFELPHDNVAQALYPSTCEFIVRIFGTVIELECEGVVDRFKSIDKFKSFHKD